MNKRRVIYYGLLVGLLIAIRTPAVRLVVEAFGQSTETALDVQQSLRNATQGFVILVAVSLYFDFVANWARSQEEDKRFASVRDAVEDLRRISTDDQLNRLSTEELISAGLNRAYGPQHPINHLVSAVLGARPPILDLTVSYRLTDHPTNADTYCLFSRERYHANLERYVIALVEGPGNLDVLLNICPDLVDFWSCPDRASLDATIDTLVNFSTVSLTVSSATGVTREIDQRLERLSQADTDLLLSEAPPEVRDRCVLFEADLPPEPIHMIKVERALVLPRFTCRTFWNADRPIFLRSISFDVRELTAPDVKFELVPFMSASARPSGPTNLNTFELVANNWIVQGQGCVLVWGDIS